MAYAFHKAEKWHKPPLTGFRAGRRECKQWIMN